MRSSKSRSRPKSSRRSVGNIVNRVFESSGPEGKVRGTPQQIIDKYLALARDATLGNDRVAAENFQQHAEHYARMLGEATREAEARREQQEAQQQQQQGRRRDQQGGEGEPRDEQRGGDGGAGGGDAPEAAPRGAGGDAAAAVEVVDLGGEGDSTLVETPESKPARRRGGGRRKPGPDAGAGEGEGGDAAASAAE